MSYWHDVGFTGTRSLRRVQRFLFPSRAFERIAETGNSCCSNATSSGKFCLNAILSVCRGSVTVYSFGLADFLLPEAPFGKPAFLETAFFLLEGAGFFLTAFFFGDFLGAAFFFLEGAGFFVDGFFGDAFFLATVCTPLPGCWRDFRLGLA